MEYKPEILRRLYGLLLRAYFSSDRAVMARTLGVSEAALTSALDEEDSAETLRVFEPSVRYCAEKRININDLLKRCL